LLRCFHGRLFGHHHHGAIPGDGDIFTKLMGDIVEPRREFIQDNSLSANVDV
jgi:DNA gyrase/topoisomerase IV subunit B